MARTYEKILEEMQNKFAELTGTAADDASDVGIRMRVLAGQIYALETQTDFIERQCFPETATGKYLERHAFQRNLTRKGESAAVGKLKFSVIEARAEDLIIPVGTIVAGSAEMRYKTIEEGVIAAGETETLVSSEACKGGVNGNAASDTVTSPVNPPAGIEAVTNPEPFTGGRGAETDEQLRKRLLCSYADMPNGANKSFFRELAMRNPNVLCADIVPTVPERGFSAMYIRSKNGEETEELREAVDDVIDANSPICSVVHTNYGGIFKQDVNVKIEVKPGFKRDEVIENCRTAIVNRLNSLMLGDDLLIADLADELYHVSGVRNYWITEPNDDISLGASLQIVPGIISVESLTQGAQNE